MVAKSNLRSSSMSFRPSIVVIQVMECGVIRAVRIFSAIQILQGTTILPLLPEVLLAPALDGHFLLLESQEQLEESLTLMLQDQTRFMGRQRQTNLLHCVVICLFGINSE